MSSLVERLRARSNRRPVHYVDGSDDDAELVPGNPRSALILEKTIRDDAKENSCQACAEENGKLLSCATCNYSYHLKCLFPLLRAPFPSNWRCPECINPLSNIEKILDCETLPTAANDTDASKSVLEQIFVKQYLVKWKGFSYLHCTWVPEKEFVKTFKSNPHLRTKVNNFHKKKGLNNNFREDYIAIRPEWTTVDRIISIRGGDDEKQYFVKWKELPYDECNWEYESDIFQFHSEIEKFHAIQSRSHRRSAGKQKIGPKDSIDCKKKEREFHHYEESPEFLSGGSLHPYQLEGLNFLQFSWSKQTHVILADEMGLGKTIQSIAFLASLFEDGLYPHLVVAPLSTLRNWEREFATWAPRMNVVMYAGSANARSIIREHEFYYPDSKNIKKKKSGHVKFDVLLTSYEIVNMDTNSLNEIEWECMIVDEGHRLKNKDSKLFSSLKQLSNRHRVLLTGTPLQNNLDELFMLMHFLDAAKFGNLEEFQVEFKDINQEEQISRLHRMLAPHLLRRVKKDVMKELPPKKELILRVDLSSKQKEYYKAILTRNYQLLTQRGGAKMSLTNVVMELRKLCCHPYMLEGATPVIDPGESLKQLLETSGKMQLLDKMMVKLKAQGHRVVIFSQFQRMLDLLEDYCIYKKWSYERIDGKVGGAQRQARIDRFNAKNSSRFCFLLSTRAGGLGINLATADTVIIYDSDWNPHADLQAMARAHRLGQTNKVMIYRLITRGTIEERMIQLTKKKMVLEHLVVGKLKAQNLNQDELDDIIRYGSKELFAEERDGSRKSRQIHYDEAAIDRLLDRDYDDPEDPEVDDKEENSFLKAFKIGNFQYKAIEEEEAETAAEDNRSTQSNIERTSYWVDLLKDKYEEHKTEEFNALGKRKRNTKQMAPIDDDDDLLGLEDVSSDNEDDTYQPELSDAEAANPQPKKRYNGKRARAKSGEPHPLMEGEGRSLRVLGFNKNERAAFLQILMRFGVGEYDWKEFVPRFRQKSHEEIQNYGMHFLAHISEDLTDSPHFADGVPKEGLDIQDVLVRIATLMLIRDKVKWESENPRLPLFTEDIVFRHPGLKGRRFWRVEHDRMLLRAVLKHGYGRWHSIVDDEDLRFQEVICHELNLPILNLPDGGEPSTSNTKPSRASSSVTKSILDTTDGAPGTSEAAVHQDSTDLHHVRDLQRRRQLEFIKRRVLLLEKGLNAECQKEFYGEAGPSQVGALEPEHELKATKAPVPGLMEMETLVAKSSQLKPIAPGGKSTGASEDDPDGTKLARLFTKKCRVDEEVEQVASTGISEKPEKVIILDD